MKVKLYEINCLINRAVVVAAVSKEDAMQQVAAWEKAWEENSDLIGVSDVELTDVRECDSDCVEDDAHEVTSRAAAIINRKD